MTLRDGVKRLFPAPEVKYLFEHPQYCRAGHFKYISVPVSGFVICEVDVCINKCAVELQVEPAHSSFLDGLENPWTAFFCEYHGKGTERFEYSFRRDGDSVIFVPRIKHP